MNWNFHKTPPDRDRLRYARQPARHVRPHQQWSCTVWNTVLFRSVASQHRRSVDLSVWKQVARRSTKHRDDSAGRFRTERVNWWQKRASTIAMNGSFGRHVHVVLRITARRRMNIYIDWIKFLQNETFLLVVLRFDEDCDCEKGEKGDDWLNRIVWRKEPIECNVTCSIRLVDKATNSIATIEK